jgi:hypothetical protein
MGSSYGMLDMTVYGRQKLWEDSPEGFGSTAVTTDTGHCH